MEDRKNKKKWSKFKDAVNRNGLVRRISTKKSSRTRTYGENIEDNEDLNNYLLLAQVYSLFIDGEQQRWEKIVDEVVRISVTVEQESPRYMYHILTVDADLQGVLDAYITVPGTQLVRCTTTFVQWKDSDQGGAWGLNFISEQAAEKFVALCSPSDNLKLKRSNSTGCLEKAPLPEPATDAEYQPTRNNNTTPCDLADILINDLVTTTTTETDMEDRQKQVNIPVSSGIRRMLSSRSGGRDIKYATYSSRRSKFAASFYDNISDEESEECRKNREEQSVAIEQTSYNDGPMTNGHSTLKQGEGTLTPGKRIPDDDSQETLPCHQPQIVVSKTAATQNSNAVADPEPLSLMDKITSPTNGNWWDDSETMEGGLRPRSNSRTSRTSSNGSNRSSNRSSSKRRSSCKNKIKSLIVGSSNDSTSNRENTQEHMAQTHSLLQAYELHLRNMNEDFDSSDTGQSSQATSSRRSTSFKRRSVKTINGNSPGLQGEFGTLTSSEREYPHGMDEDYLDTDEIKPFMLKDEDLDSDDSDSHSFSSHNTQASAYTQRGAIRKAGWLHCKSLLVQKKKKVERSANRKWKEYWVCLKGTMLLFYRCEDRMTPDSNIEPRHMLVVEGGIAQAVPEHPKRDNIFCLSTAFGDAYLLQTQSQIELENWITGIHSACASALARQQGKEDTIRLLRNETQKLEQQIESETKMKKMAELQLTVVVHAKNRQAIISQIAQWDQNLEHFHLQLYRHRCYMASLQGSELPNPKTLLACVSKPTKTTLAKLDFFSVSSFHALVSARNPMCLQGRFTKPRSRKQKGLFGTLKRASRGATALAIDAAKMAESNDNTAPPTEFEESNQQDTDGNEPDAMGEIIQRQLDEELLQQSNCLSEQLVQGALVKVMLPYDQSTMITLRPGMTVLDLLICSCVNRKMDYHNYYVRFKQALKFGTDFNIPDKGVLVEKAKFDEIEICAKCIHQVELFKFNDSMDFGFIVEAELGDDAEREDQLCVFISETEKGGLAYHKDLHVGDELLCIQGRVVSDLDMLFIENLLQTSLAVTLTVRSSRAVFAQTKAMLDTNKYIDQLTCPPPPCQSRLTDDVIGQLIIPAPNMFDESDDVSDSSPTLTTSEPNSLKFMYDPVEEELLEASLRERQRETKYNPRQIEKLLKGVEQITDLCRMYDPSEVSIGEEDSDGLGRPIEGRTGDDADRGHGNAAAAMQSAHKLRKVIHELQETERAYVKDLNCLVTRYLEPLQNESFLTADEIDALFGNVKEIIKFQKVFLKCLEESTDVTDFDSFSSPLQFKRTLFSLGGAFLYYMDHFKLYSAFCACHSRSQKILDPSRTSLMQFLEARNPKNQHSSSLESYLIKPIQRVLKYPLLLNEMRSQLDVESEEYYHLSQANKGMGTVASHINDMMRVHEEYGDIFDSLVAEQYHVKKELVGTKVSDLAMDDLILYNTVTWLNSQDDLGKVKRGKEPEVIVFVFRPAVVIICKDKYKKEKHKKGSMRGVPLLTEDYIRFKWMVPVSAMQVKDASIGDSDYLSLWELVHTKAEGKAEKFFQFLCSTSELKSLFVKTIKQNLRDFKYNKNTASGKFTLGRPKTYTPFSGKRLEGLPRPKRTLRASLQHGESNRSGEVGSQCSEERSSGSNSTKGDRSEGDQFDSLETDSSSTGNRTERTSSMKRRSSFDSGMHSNDSNSLTGSNKDSDQLNTNRNNNTDQPSLSSSNVDSLGITALGRDRHSVLTPTHEELGRLAMLDLSIAVSSKYVLSNTALLDTALSDTALSDTALSDTALLDIVSANQALRSASSLPVKQMPRTRGQRSSVYDNCGSTRATFVTTVSGDGLLVEHSTTL